MADYPIKQENFDKDYGWFIFTYKISATSIFGFHSSVSSSVAFSLRSSRTRRAAFFHVRELFAQSNRWSFLAGFVAREIL